MKVSVFVLLLSMSITVEGKIVGHWRMNEDVASTTVGCSINNLNGTSVRNTSLMSATGKIGNCFTFNGSTDYITLGNGSAVNEVRRSWHKYASNPVFGPSKTFASVIKVGSTYKMFYTVAANTGLATSTDGKTWSDQGVVHVGVGVPSVFYENGVYHKIYRFTDANDGDIINIGHATSTDGTTWVRDVNNNPIIKGGDGEWDDTHLDPWGVMKVGSTYYLYYSRIAVERKIGIATSTDLHTWTKDANNPIFEGNRFCASTFKYGDYYYILVPRYYYGTTDYTEIELWKDKSPTFYDGEREFVKSGVECGFLSAGDWDGRDTDTPWVLTDDVNRDTFEASNNQLWCYYAGANSVQTWSVGMTIEPDISKAVQPTALSIAVWAKWTATTVNLRIVSKGETYLTKDYQLFAYLKGFAFGNNGGWKYTNTFYNDGLWHFCVVVWDGGRSFDSFKIYVDGEEQACTEVGSFNIHYTLQTTNEPLCIGAQSDDGVMESYWNGSLDDLMIFDHALTAAERERIYYGGNGTEMLGEIDDIVSPRRLNNMKLSLRARYE